MKKMFNIHQYIVEKTIQYYSGKKTIKFLYNIFESFYENKKYIKDMTIK